MQVGERRFHTGGSPTRLSCRVCFAVVTLNPQRIRHADGYWVMQCPQCSGSFPVRADDALRAG